MGTKSHKVFGQKEIKKFKDNNYLIKLKNSQLSQMQIYMQVILQNVKKEN